MAIPKTVTRAILLVGKETAIMKELIAAGTITPGHLVAIDSAGKWVANPTASAKILPAFADMCDYNGGDIDDNYVANDNVQAWIVQSGSEINGLVAAAAPAIAVGDYLTGVAGGTVAKTVTAAQYMFQALEAVDNSAGGTPARLRFIVL
jgi:hypothetical protein